MGVKKPHSTRKVRERGYTHLSSKNQATIPVDVLKEAGIKAGDRLKARADGPGRVVLQKEGSSLEIYSDALRGVSEGRFLETLRDEWGSR